MQRRSSMATPESSNDLGSHKFRSLMARVGKTRKGTGPRTRLGKERNKHNALRHGIFSKAAILTSESQPEFDSLLNGLCKDFRPIGRLEELSSKYLPSLCGVNVGRSSRKQRKFRQELNRSNTPRILTRLFGQY